MEEDKMVYFKFNQLDTLSSLLIGLDLKVNICMKFGNILIYQDTTSR